MRTEHRTKDSVAVSPGKIRTARTRQQCADSVWTITLAPASPIDGLAWFVDTACGGRRRDTVLCLGNPPSSPARSLARPDIYHQRPALIVDLHLVRPTARRGQSSSKRNRYSKRCAQRIRRHVTSAHTLNNNNSCCSAAVHCRLVVMALHTGVVITIIIDVKIKVTLSQ